MFFPAAALRLACSFFTVPRRAGATFEVTLCPPILGARITSLLRRPRPGPPLVVGYLSAQRPFGQELPEVLAAFQEQPDAEVHLFGRGLGQERAGSVQLHEHGDPGFLPLLAACHGIVATAGHTLLSEAMFLGIPVYAVPLPVYEQQMNAQVIAANGFGVSRPRVEPRVLEEFLRALPEHRAAIAADRSVLLREPGLPFVLEQLRAAAGRSRPLDKHHTYAYQLRQMVRTRMNRRNP